MLIRKLKPAIIFFLGLVFLNCNASMLAQQIPSDYQEVLKHLGRQGDYKADVLKVNVPRSDLSVKVSGTSLSTPFGFGGWVAMTHASDGNDVMMGDLVLQQDEVNAVMSALLEHGLEVTALHNHFFWEEPRLFYMHIHGHGKPLDLAQRVKPALDRIGKRAPGAASGGPAPGTVSSVSDPAQQKNALDTAKIASIIGHDGEQTGPVYKITIGRDDISLKEMGATINARMGLNTWAAFAGTNEKASIAGDVAMLEREVTPVLKALRKSGLDVVSIHHHMIGISPQVIFLHYWGQGPAQKLATGFRAALDEIGKSSDPVKVARN